MLRIMVIAIISSLALAGCGEKTTEEKVEDANNAIARMNKTSARLGENGVWVNSGKQAYFTLDVKKMSDETLDKNIKLVSSFISDGNIVMDAANDDRIEYGQKALLSQFLANARSALSTLKAEKAHRKAEKASPVAG